MEKFSVKKPFTVLVGVIMVLVLGVVAITSMAMDLLPSISIPTLMVITTYPGASAEKVEADVTTVLESNLGTISGVTDVNSTSSENFCMVQLSFEDGTDMDSVFVKVSSAVQNASAYLPETCGVPSIIELSMDMMATMYLSVSYEGNDVYALSDFVSSTVTPKIERTSGVASVTEVGIVEKTIYVELNQEKIDDVNARILQEVDGGLAEAKDALDEADREVQKALDELADAQATFGETVGDALAGQMETPMNDMVVALQEQLSGLSEQLNDAKLNAGDFGGGGTTTPEVDPTMVFLVAMASLSADEQAGMITLLNTVNVADPNDPTALAAQLQAQLTDGTATTTVGLTEVQVSGVSTALALMTVYENAATAEAALRAMDIANPVDLITLHNYLYAVQMAMLQATGTTTAQEAFIYANMVLAALEQSASDSVTDALLSIDPTELSAVLDSYNNAIGEVQGSIWSLYAQMEEMPALVNTLIGVYTGLTQVQLEAAVGFSTAQISLTLAQQELESARTQYEAAQESALANANVDALLDVNVLSQLIYAQNFSMPAGYIEDASGESWLLKVGQEYETTEQLADALLLSMDGVGDVTVSDVADVVVLDNADETYASMNGDSAVILAVFKGSTAGTNEVGANVIKAYEALEQKYEGLHVSVLMNQGDYIDIIVNSVVSSMVIGALLAIIILAIFLKDIKPTLVVGISIPLSVLFAIVLMYFTDLSLNMMTLCGLALGIGMLVDNSIVVIENIYRLRARGVSSARAAVQGTRQVAGAIISSTLTTVCVFVPLAFTSGTVRELLMPMGLCVGYCLFASLIVALTVVPASASTLLRNSKNKPHPWFDKVQDFYGKTLDYCLRKKAVPMAVTIVLLLLCVWQVFQMGIVVIPSMSADQIQVNVTTDEGLTRQESYAQADAAMMAMLEIENVTEVGAMSASAASSMMGFSMGGDDSYGSYIYYITASENAGTAEIDKVCEDINEKLDALGIEGEASAGGMSDLSAMTASGLSITITGDDIDTLAATGKQVAALIADVEGYDEIFDGVGEGEDTILVDIDKDKAMECGLTVAQIYMEIASYLTDEATSTTLTVDGESMTVVVQDLTSPLTAENLMDIEFEATSPADAGASGGMGGMDLSAFAGEEEEEEDEADDAQAEDDDNVYRLSEFATKVETISVASISRTNQARYLTVSASTLEGYNATLLAREVEEIITAAQKEGAFPDGYTVTVGGESDEVMEMVSQMMLMVLLALIFIYLVMVAQFQSLLSPFIVLFTIPLAFTGGLLALLFAGEQLSMISIMGFLVLMGTVVNNGIVFVDYANQLRIGGMERRAALVATGKTRMRPIFMTAMTTILAMVQLMMGDDMSSQMSGGMALVITGGLIYATVMTLYVIPIMYDIFFKRQPLAVDIGSENLDDVPDDAAEFIAQALAEENAKNQDNPL